MRVWRFLPILLVCSAVSCMKTSTQDPPMTQPTPMASATSPAPSSGTAAVSGASSDDGVVNSAFYDDQQFTINFKEQPPAAEAALLAHNGSVNTIYLANNCVPGGKPFIAVLDAIQGDGFNALWNEVEINFKTPSACKQFTSDDAILAAAHATNPTITLHPTTEVYRCSVIAGPKK